LPLNEIIYDFFDALKSRTRGYASFDYEMKNYQKSDLVKLDILLNGDMVDALSFIVHKEKAYARGRRIAEKLITKAIHQYDNTVTVTKTVKDKDGNMVSVDVVNDAPAKLAVRRQLMSYLYDVPETKGEKESKLDYKKRTKDNNHPVVEKLFREIAPKYDARAKELGQGGGYTRILKKGPRRGDATEMVILELV
jgi:large subunit ribosomal protein L17